MTGSEHSINIRLSKVVVSDDGSNTSATQDTSLSSSSSSSSASSCTCTNPLRDDQLHSDDDLWSPHRQPRWRGQPRGRNNSWDTTLSGITFGSEHSTTPPTRRPVTEDYLSRRNKRLAALRASRQERLQRTPSTISQAVGSSASSSPSKTSALMCMEDHPYYLAQQERKLQQLKDKMDQVTTLPTTPTSSETITDTKTRAEMSANVPMDLLEELTSAYQLIHRQRLYLQHLLQQQQQQQPPSPPSEKAKLSRRSRSSNSSSSLSSLSETTARALIRQLQNQLVHLEHDKAEREFVLCNRIAHDAMQYQDRLKYLETKVEYWQLRSRNERESHEDAMLQANRRIQELEEAVHSHNKHHQQQKEEIVHPPVHLVVEKNAEPFNEVAAANHAAGVDKRSSNNNNIKSHVDSCALGENASSSPSRTLYRDASVSASSALNFHHKVASQCQQQQGRQQQQPPSLSGHIYPSVSQAELIESVMKKQKGRVRFFRVYGART